ncbi:hypothetical protein MMC25_002310 [Agyrium rufum]|nr:hypothetical protein [Agyrium rufum]
MADPAQIQLQALTDEFQKIETDLQNAIGARQALESQQQENLGVQKEFAKLSDDANIYKLVGPVLLKQDHTEAVSTVDGRLEFIGKEIERIEKQIKEHQQSSESKRMNIYQLQTQLQQQQSAVTST